MLRWGIVSTIKSPVADTLNFAAHHLDLGAHRIYIHLDEPAPVAFSHLKAHPKIRVTTCDDKYWTRLGRRRPAKHQVRQTANATRTYTRPPEVDWLAHIDVDEFLCPDRPVGDVLAALPADTLCARMRPMEQLSGGDGTAFKRFIPPGPDRDHIAARLYPRFGEFVKGGFLSHLAGKLFVRTGHRFTEFRIHNAYMGEDMNPGETELEDVALCHCHARDWESWHAALAFRREKGAYRADLAPNRPREKGGITLHELLADLEKEEGADGLRAFVDEFCADTPSLRARLKAEGLLHCSDLDLDSKRRKHFPDFG